MGYRSEVAFVVPVTAPKFEEFDKHSEPDSIYEKDGYRLYHYDWIKWYDDDMFCQEVESYIRNNPDNCLFIRLGENDGDLESIGRLWDNIFNLGYIRQIRFDD